MSPKNTVRLITIQPEYVGQRIDNFLFLHLKGVPKSLIYRIIRKGEIRINKKRVKPEYKIQAGDQIRIPPLQLPDKADKTVPIHLKNVQALEKRVIYEDQELLLLNKPSGMAVHGGSGLNFGVIEAMRTLRPQAQFLELVHRLDRETSGLLVIAKKRSALRILHEQLRNKQVYKEYVALVKGQWPKQCNVVKAPLKKNILAGGERIVKVNLTEGKASETHFAIEETFRDSTLIIARPITGRTHQIRVHTAYTGHPIAFDNRYGDRNFDKTLADTQLTRLFLHARSIRLIHPLTKKALFFSAPMDEMLVNCLERLRQLK